MANTPRNSNKTKPPPKGRATKANSTETPSSGAAKGVSDTSTDRQENVPPPTATPRPRPQPIRAGDSSPRPGERTPLRTPGGVANSRGGGGHVTSQALNMDAMSAQLKALQESLEHERAERKRFEALSRQTRTEAEAEPARADDRLKELEAELERERMLTRQLRTQRPLARQSGQSDRSQDRSLDDDETPIPRPRGVAGKDYSIQVEMKLATSERNKQKYEQVLRGVRDLLIQSQINWELPWAEISAADKAKLFNVARERHPILARYTNDWATSDMVRRYMKNKRSHHYKNGWLDVPEKYSYLKKNSSHRNPHGSRTSRAKAVLAAKRRNDRRVAAGSSSRAPDADEYMDVDADSVSGEEGEGEEDNVDMDQ